MSLTSLSVRRPTTAIMLFLALTILGVFTFSRLKLDMLPDLEFPVVAVITQYKGADPGSIEQLVTRPIEEAMASVENVQDIESTSSQDSSLVLVKFAWGSDMQAAENEVRKNLEIFALDMLPSDASRPLTFAFDPALQPVVFLTVDAPGTPNAVRTMADDMVKPYLARIQGVAAAELLGGIEREIQVRLKPDWLEAYGIPAQQVVQALRGANVMFPGGRIDQGRQQLSISTDAEFDSVADIGETVVGVRNGLPVQVSDIADVVDGFAEETSVVRANGNPSVMMAIRKQSDANTVDVANRVIAELPNIEKRLPEGARITPVFDQGEPIERSLSNLSSTALISIFLTGLVLLAFLRNWRTSLIVLVSIPLAMLVTFAVMDFQSVTLNIISMAGLALAVGMLVDNAIVVLENIFTLHNEGHDPKAAAIEGTKEIAMPITASTLTTVAVFAPVLFVPGLAGQMFKDMSLTIVIALGSSLLVALTLVPLLASLFLRARQKISGFERLMGRLTFWLDPLADRYAVVLNKALRNRKKVLTGALVTFVLSLALAPLLGVDFMPKVDDGRIELSFETTPGSSLAATNALVQEVENVIHETAPETEVIVTQFGGGDEAFSALFGQSSYKGDITVKLVDREKRSRTKFEVADVLRDRLSHFAGIEVKPRNPNFLGGEGDVSIKVFGDDLQQVRAYGANLKSRMEALEGATDVRFNLEEGVPELTVDLDREQIKLLGLTPADVASTISTYFLGTIATMYRESGDEFRVLVRSPRFIREDIEALRSLPIVTPAGLQVPLETVATIKQSLGPTAITRENQRRMGTVSVSADGIPLGTLIERTQGVLNDIGQETGITTVVAGTAEDLAESFMALGIAFLVAIILVYMVMASQFESLIEPFVILSTIPLALSGVIFALLLTGTTLQVTALIGLVLLAGIVVNNGIVLIDVIKQKREAGEDLVEAAIDAGRRRLRPVLMTTLTTILGMVPLAFELGQGAEMWTPMARAVIGGLLFSTLLTLVVVPTSYVMLAGYADRRKARKAERRVAKTAEESYAST